jgi:hypothetical protein
MNPGAKWFLGVLEKGLWDAQPVALLSILGDLMEPVLAVGTRQPQRQAIQTELGKLTPLIARIQV